MGKTTLCEVLFCAYPYKNKYCEARSVCKIYLPGKGATTPNLIQNGCN